MGLPNGPGKLEMGLRNRDHSLNLTRSDFFRNVQLVLIPAEDYSTEPESDNMVECL